MNKLIFRKFSLDILNFFLIASFSITFIVWIIQAVNFLDLVSDDGHSLKVYFYYVSLNFPKIFSKTIIFVFFISVFYVINKYSNSNELIVFWNNGIKKIYFINFVLKLSIVFLILQLFLNLFVVPKSQNLARVYLKESNIDFLPKLISEKKFINVVKNLTIFVEEFRKDGVLSKIYINEKIDQNNSKIIVAALGKIIKKDNQFYLRLYNGGITNINQANSFALNFSETALGERKYSFVSNLYLILYLCINLKKSLYFSRGLFSIIILRISISASSTFFLLLFLVTISIYEEITNLRCLGVV